MGHLQLNIDFDLWKKREYGDDLEWDILKDYKREEDYIEFHKDDKDLGHIQIFLPTAPDWRKIDGFGLPAREQKFTLPKIPQKLKDLEKEVKYWKEMNGSRDDVVLDDMHDYLIINQRNYRDEIAFLRKMWYHRLYGYWCFINGTPTYIDGWHWMYCTHWPIDIGIPDYRDRDRRFFLAVRYFYETTEAPYTMRCSYLWGEELKYAYFNSKKEYEQFKVRVVEDGKADGVDVSAIGFSEGRFVVDKGKRTVLGVNYPKHRREGATYKASEIAVEILTRSIKSKAGTLSLTGDHALKAFKFHVMAPFRAMAWYFKPNYEGSDDSKHGLSLKPSARRIGSKGTFLSNSDGLESVYDPAKTSSGSYFDSQKLIFLHTDEIGKTDKEDVYARHDVTKHTLQMGDGAEMIGFGLNTSTVGEMSKRGGEKFFKLCQASKHEDRNQSGNTQTRLVNIFIPAYDGLQGFIGEYGESIIDTPTPEQSAYIKSEIGARRHLEISEQDIRSRTDADMMADLNEQKRLNPTQYRDCFRKNTSDNGFNIAILSDRNNELRFLPDATETGDFEFDELDMRVHWVRKSDGPFELSLNLGPNQSNQFAKGHNGLWTPLNKDKFIASSDAFRFSRTEGNKMSKGGGAVFWNRDYNIDPHDKPISEWSSHRFVCDYIDRPRTKLEYTKKMLYMCLYFGCEMSPEINVTDVWDFFETEGFSEFLYYFKDISTGLPRKTPGFNSLTGSKNDIFNAWRDYIEVHGMRERHRRLLKQVEDIDGPEEMTKYDLFTAGGGCLISANAINPPSLNPLGGRSNQEEDTIDLNDFYSYRLR